MADREIVLVDEVLPQEAPNLIKFKLLRRQSLRRYAPARVQPDLAALRALRGVLGEI